MVGHKTRTYWTCPYCGKEYEDYSDAHECAEDCAQAESPENTEKPVIFCEYCKKEYETEEKASDCENNHIKDEDEYYDEFSRKKLKEASGHPNQTTLNAEESSK